VAGAPPPRELLAQQPHLRLQRLQAVQPTAAGWACRVGGGRGAARLWVL
jgi:hypothetical protein